MLLRYRSKSQTKIIYWFHWMLEKVSCFITEKITTVLCFSIRDRSKSQTKINYWFHWMWEDISCFMFQKIFNKRLYKLNQTCTFFLLREEKILEMIRKILKRVCNVNLCDFDRLSTIFRQLRYLINLHLWNLLKDWFHGIRNR